MVASTFTIASIPSLATAIRIRRPQSRQAMTTISLCRETTAARTETSPSEGEGHGYTEAPSRVESDLCDTRTRTLAPGSGHGAPREAQRVASTRVGRREHGLDSTRRRTLAPRSGQRTARTYGPHGSAHTSLEGRSTTKLAHTGPEIWAAHGTAPMPRSYVVPKVPKGTERAGRVKRQSPVP